MTTLQHLEEHRDYIKTRLELTDIELGKQQTIKALLFQLKAEVERRIDAIKAQPNEEVLKFIDSGFNTEGP